MSAEEQHSEQEGRVGSLYRRHRPRTFADVVGQEPVVRTLRNAIERGKVHHAYLFVGSRGTGKTSMAKILAACLNCENGPTIEPCGVCDSCRSIATATSLDVIEMDAASNNSVDDIRELRESVAYAPVSGRRKIYILDEAHMLSTAAWNAFLKTLEEPPPNTVFVLATTEANKVPATVIDRCHRFDFHRPTVEQIASVLRRAADAESIEIPPPALAAIARSATGSFRDGLGTLEQLVTYSGSLISLEDVLAVLGVADSRLLAQAVDAVAAGDARAALGALESCAAQGRDAASFAVDLEVRLRELMIVGTLGEVPAELSLTPESDAALAEQAAAIPPPVVVRLLELLGEALEAIRAGADARTRLELALVKASRPETDTSLRALLARIERLEQSGAGTVSAVASQHEVAIPTAPTPVLTSQPVPAADASPVSSPAPAAQAAPNASADSAAQGSAALAAQAPSSAGEPASSVGPDAPPPAAGQPATVAGAMVAESRVAVEDPPPAQIAAGLDSVVATWPAVVDVVRAENALLGALIAEARPVEVQGEELTLAFASTFLKKKAEDPANRMTVAEALRVVTGGRWKLLYELRDDLGEVAAIDASGDGDSEARWLARFMEEFDAEDITPGAGPGGEEPDLSTLTSNEKGP
ncbi:MAG TPA: DNA polymerase III subunit gamma/tau [Solirubrobacteraceae bacterium]|nr:DNA polymerase III subunit gamma/tau [Solirubrobacteraceae bacterium]